MKYITVIPARGGSKRFPKKNIYPLSGMPLIGHSILYSLNEPMISETYVSTDSKEIKMVSEHLGAKVLMREPELSGDYVPTSEVLKNVADKLLSMSVSFDYIVLLQPTNPLRPSSLLKDAINCLENGDYDSLMTVNKSTQKLGRIIEGSFVPWNYKFGMRSQDLAPLYYENGLLYITSKEEILKGNILGQKMYPMIVDHIYGEVDIDTFEDLQYAEFLCDCKK